MTIPTRPVYLGAAVAYLATPSDRSVVDYYRCACGHVWTADKVDQSVVTHVTLDASRRCRRYTRTNRK